MEIEICNICKAEFRKGMLEEGKCSKCIELYPTAVNPEDRHKKNEADKENEGRLKNVVDKQIKAMLTEYGILNECDCGKLFYKRSPNQKSCGCGNKKETN